MRWQTIQLLLGPAEHVPILQDAVKRFDIINPQSREPFPKHLPSEAFPARPDPHMTRWHEEVMHKEFGRSLQQRPERRKSKTAEDSESSTDSSADDTSNDDSGGYSRRRPKPDPLVPTRHRRSHTNSPRDHGVHSVNGGPRIGRSPGHSPGRSPSHHYQNDRRRSLPFNDPAWDRDGPTPTVDSHRRHSPHVPRPPTPSLLSIASGSEATDESFMSTAGPSPTSPRMTRNRPSFHEGPRPYYDKHGRRHSAHSPYDERDHVSIPQSKSQSTLSPPFFASQAAQAPPQPTGHQYVPPQAHPDRPRSGSKVRWRDENVVSTASAATTPSVVPPTVRFGGQESYFDDRPRRKPTDAASCVGGRRYHEGSGWK